MLHVMNFHLSEDTDTDLVKGHGRCKGKLYIPLPICTCVDVLEVGKWGIMSIIMGIIRYGTGYNFG